MLLELIIFLLSLGLGFLFRFVFLGIVLLNKKLKNKAAAITIEFIIAGFFVLGLVSILFFFNDGAFAFYPIFASLMGVVLASLIR